MNSQQLISKSKKFKKATWITSIFGIILLAFSIWALDYLDSETIDVFFHSGAYILIIPRVLLSGLKIYTNRKIGADPSKPNQPRANFHPTVKPTALMEYLIKMVTKE